MLPRELPELLAVGRELRLGVDRDVRDGLLGRETDPREERLGRAAEPRELLPRDTERPALPREELLPREAEPRDEPPLLRALLPRDWPREPRWARASSPMASIAIKEQTRRSRLFVVRSMG